MNLRKILKETEAFNAALALAESEDIVIVFFEKSEPLIEILRSKNNIENNVVDLAAK